MSEFEQHKLSVMARVFVNQIYKLFLLHKAGSMPGDQWELAATEADQILNLTEFGRTFRKENVAYWQMWEEMDSESLLQIVNLLVSGSKETKTGQFLWSSELLIIQALQLIEH